MLNTIIVLILSFVSVFSVQTISTDDTAISESVDEGSIYQPLDDSGLYYNIDNSIYYGRTHEILGADKDSFQIIDNQYSKDKNHYYYLNKQIPVSDFNSFEVLNEEYSKDKNTVFFHEQKLDEADSTTFITLDKGSADITFAGDDNPFAFGYAKDKEHAYMDGVILPDIDPSGFGFLGKSFTKDKNNIFFNGMEIGGADLLSFQILQYPFSQDKNTLYYSENPVNEADKASFQILNMFYAKDKNHVYHWNYIYFKPDEYIFEGADPMTFEIIYCGEFPLFTKDINHVYDYFRREPIDYMDAKTFNSGSDGCTFQDKNHTYDSSGRIKS